MQIHSLLARGAALVAISAAFTTVASAASLTLDFNAPVLIGPSPAPNTWYTDRYSPGGFTSPVLFGGDNRLLETIVAADGLDNRPAPYQSSFYNTQGRTLDLTPTTTGMSIDLFVPSDWATANKRMAGLWGVGYDPLNNINWYPIIEFFSDGATGKFRYWDGVGAWVDLGLPTGFTYDSWTTLGISLLPTDQWLLQAGDKSGTIGADGTAYIGSTILQGHNTQTGVNYNIYWDNLTYNTAAAAVPEPSTLLLIAALAAGLGLRKRLD